MSDSTPQPQKPMVPVRMLVINVMLGMLVSVVVFAVGATLFVLPSLAGQSVKVSELRLQVDSLKARVAQLEAAAQPPEAIASEPAAPAEPVQGDAVPAPAAAAEGTAATAATTP